MAARSATLSIRVLVDAAQGARELNRLGDSASSIGDKFAKVAAAGAAFAGVTAFIKGAVDAASRLQQSTGGVEAVFKDSAGAVKDWAKESAQALGLSQSAYQDMATLIGSQLKNAGTSMDQLAPSTKRLIEQGADLAAMYGGTTAEAVQAMSSALKGERDPIEKYGISLNEAAVQAKILEMGLDTSTNAAKQNAKAMATLALIQDQGTDAWGAAAREADSYAAVQQRMSAVWENTMASVGSALLPILSELGQAFADMAPMIGSVLGVLASLLGLVLQLPTPILAAAAAFAAWKVLGLGSVFSGLQSAWAGFAREMQSAKIGSFLSQSGQSMNNFQAATAAAQKQYGGFLSSLGKSAAGFAAFAVAGLAVSQFIASLNDGEAVVKSFDTAVAGLTESMVSAGSADWSDGIQASYEAAARASDSFAALTQAGVDAGTAMRYLTDQGFQPTAAEAAQLQGAVEGMDWELALSTSRFREQASAAQSNAQDLLSKKAADMAAAESAAANGTATAEQTQALQKQAEAAAKSATENAKVAAEQTGVSQAMRDAAAATAAASRAADAFALAMDQLAGRNITAEQAALALNNGMRGLQEAFTGAADKGGYSVDALAEWNVAALTATEGGAQLYGSLNDVRSGYDASVSAAYSQAAANGDAAAGMAAARSAADGAYASFIGLATQAGLTGDQAATLAAKLGIVAGTDIPDKTFELIAQDQQAQAAITTAQQAEIDTKTVNVEAMIAPVMGQFSMITGQKLDNTVAVDANTSQATGQIDALTKAQRSTTVQTQADTNAAQSTLQGFTSAQRSTSVTVQANTSPAQEAITALVNQRRTLTITVEANTNPAQQAINNIQGKTVTVTVQQNTIQSVTPAPAPALAGVMEASMAPTAVDYGPLRLNTGVSTTSSENTPQPIIINVSGALDPDAVARQIEGLLARSQRRRQGVHIGSGAPLL